MKVYAVWAQRYRVAYTSADLFSLHTTREGAEAYKDRLDAENEQPVESDDYGPYGGVEYVITDEAVLT